MSFQSSFESKKRPAQVTVPSRDAKPVRRPMPSFREETEAPLGRSVSDRSMSAALSHDFNRIPVHAENHRAATQQGSCPLIAAGPRSCPFGGACHTCPARVQTKPVMNQSGDQYEQEADRAAEEAMRVKETTENQAFPILRKERSIQRRNMRRDDEEGRSIGPQELPGRSTAVRNNFDAPPVVNEVVSSPGRSLDAETRSFMKSRFGRDFNGVRVHTDAKAAESARQANARAYTLGQHIVFDAGAYAPATQTGRRLLAHELVHTIQQDGNSGYAAVQAESSPNIGSVDDPQEREAERLSAAAISKGSLVHVSERTGPSVLRREVGSRTAPPGQAQSPATGGAASSTRQPVQVAPDVDLGRFSRYQHGRADARLDRRPALAHLSASEAERPPCQLELILRLRFDFHLGPSPYRQGPQGSLTEPGPPWPAERAARWKREYIRQVQEMWHTTRQLEKAGNCPEEPCTRAIGQLRIVDVDAMTDSQGRPVSGERMSREPHFLVHVYELRPWAGRSESRVGWEVTMYEDDILPRGTRAPAGLDQERYKWEPGSASHETGHMLGRPHVACGPDVEDPNQPRCYGDEGTQEQRDNIMGRGGEVSREDNAPFLAGMRATTGCEWSVPGGGWPWWAYLLLFVPVLGWLALGLLAAAGQLRS